MQCMYQTTCLHFLIVSGFTQVPDILCGGSFCDTRQSVRKPVLVSREATLLLCHILVQFRIILKVKVLLFSTNYCKINLSRPEELMIAYYFTHLVGEHCRHMMMKSWTLEHKHHNNSSLLIVTSLYSLTSLN